MINVKDQVYAGLSEKLENVSDTYPRTWENLPAIQFVEEDNRVAEYTNKEEKSYIRYRVDIWHNSSTSNIALTVDKVMAGFGLKRTQCSDVDDPSGLKHKLMRYEGIVDVNTEEVYHEM